MEQVHIRQQDGNSNLWWVSSPSGDDVAYITHLGNSYLVWATEPAPAGFVGKGFDTVDAALAEVVKSVLTHIGHQPFQIYLDRVALIAMPTEK